jgi:hypothetical protein
MVQHIRPNLFEARFGQLVFQAAVRSTVYKDLFVDLSLIIIIITTENY